MTTARLDRFTPPAGGRPIWLATLADLGLLLVGFFVFLHASRHIDGSVIADSLRRGFVATAASAPPMPVGVARVDGFAAGVNTTTRSLTGVAGWAHDIAADPRTVVRLAGSVDGSTADVDPATGSAALLANDRARTIATALIERGALSPNRIIIDPPARDGARAVTLTLGFAGAGKDLPDGQ